MAQDSSSVSFLQAFPLLAREFRRRNDCKASETQRKIKALIDDIHPQGYEMLDGIDINDDRSIARILNACVYSEKFQEERDPVENPAELALTAAEKHAVDALVKLTLTAAENQVVDALAKLYNRNGLLRDVIRLLILTRSNRDFKFEGVFFKVWVIKLLPYLLALDPTVDRAQYEIALSQLRQTCDVLRNYETHRIKSENSTNSKVSQTATTTAKESDIKHAERSTTLDQGTRSKKETIANQVDARNKAKQMGLIRKSHLCSDSTGQGPTKVTFCQRDANLVRPKQIGGLASSNLVSKRNFHIIDEPPEVEKDVASSYSTAKRSKLDTSHNFPRGRPLVNHEEHQKTEAKMKDVAVPKTSSPLFQSTRTRNQTKAAMRMAEDLIYDTRTKGDVASLGSDVIWKDDDFVNNIYISADNDRSPCVLGKPDISKLKITYHVERPDKRNPSRNIRLEDVVYYYRHSLLRSDWNNPDVITAINKWRAQNFVRLIGPLIEKRSHWIIPEMHKLCDFLEPHLRTAEVGGRWSLVDWDAIQETYNNYWAGKTQSGSELKAETKYFTNNGSPKNSSTKQLGLDREAPKRTGCGLRNAMNKFTDPRATSLVAAARDADCAAGHVDRSGPRRRRITIEQRHD
ncbi:hypothetical protein ACMFMF_007477 [Clarireedia jacksonii]